MDVSLSILSVVRMGSDAPPRERPPAVRPVTSNAVSGGAEGDGVRLDGNDVVGRDLSVSRRRHERFFLFEFDCRLMRLVVFILVNVARKKVRMAGVVYGVSGG